MPARKTEGSDKDESAKEKDAPAPGDAQAAAPRELGREALEALRRKLQARYH